MLSARRRSARRAQFTPPAIRRGGASFVRRAYSDGRVQFYSFKDTEKLCFSVFYAYI